MYTSKDSSITLINVHQKESPITLISVHIKRFFYNINGRTLKNDSLYRINQRTHKKIPL